MNEWIKQWMIYMNEWLIEWLNGWMNEFILRERREKYQSMDSTKKTELLTKLHDNYKSIDPARKAELQHRRKSRKENSKCKMSSIESCITQFNIKIREGPFFICNVCHRLLYKKSVKLCNVKKYSCETYFNSKQSLCSLYNMLVVVIWYHVFTFWCSL